MILKHISKCLYVLLPKNPFVEVDTKFLSKIKILKMENMKQERFKRT